MLHRKYPALLALAISTTGFGSGFISIPAVAADAVSITNTEQTAQHHFDIAPGSLASVLNRLASTANITLSFDPTIVGRLNSSGVQGNYSVDDALKHLLVNTELQHIHTPSGGYIVAKPSQARVQTLPSVQIVGDAIQPNEIPTEYAGGQVARGGGLGMIGNTDFMDASFNITSYTSGLIENQQARSIANIVDNDPSVQVSSRGRGTNVSGGEAFFIRGFTVRNQDVSMNGLYGVLPRNTIGLESVERVEIMKGPNALLNGVSPWGSVGGGINVVPKRAMDEPLTRVTATYRSDTQLGTHLDVGRRFGDNKNFGVRFNGVYMEGDTAVQRQTSMLGMASVGMDYRGERLRLSGDIGYQKDRTDGASGFGSGLKVSDASSVPDAIDPSESTAQDWERTENKDVYVALHAEYDLMSNITLYGGAGGRNNTPFNLRTNHTLIDSENTLASFPVY